MNIGVIGARDFINFNDINVQVRYLENEPGDGFEPDILILNGAEDIGIIEKWVKKLKKNNILIINADERKLYRFLYKCKCGFLTYGFNSKACVTASSVMEGDGQTIQVCVLRSFESFAGERILQQEFSVYLPGAKRNVPDILASVTVSLLCGGARN